MKSWISARLLGSPVGILWLLAILFAVSVSSGASAQQQDYFLRQVTTGPNDVVGGVDSGFGDGIVGQMMAEPMNGGVVCVPEDEEPLRPFCMDYYSRYDPRSRRQVFKGFYYSDRSKTTGSCRSIALYDQGYFSTSRRGTWTTGYFSEDDPCVPFQLDSASFANSRSVYGIDTDYMMEFFPDLPEGSSWSDVSRLEKLQIYRSGLVVCEII